MAGLLMCGLWLAFWNDTTCVDERMLFGEAQELAHLTWPEFLDEVVHHMYVDEQVPFLTFWFSRMPILWAQQLLWFPWALLCAGLMWELYGRNAVLLMGTPVFALMIHQPCHDTLLFGMLLIALRLVQLSGVQPRHCSAVTLRKVAKSEISLQRWRCTPLIVLAAVVYGLTWMIKPLTILTAPFILPQLGIFGWVSLAMWGGYICWSLKWEFGRYQFSFLLHQLMFRSMKPSGTRTVATQMPLSQWATLLKRLNKIRNTLRWRWEHLGSKAVKALLFYLFPVYARPWLWQGIALAVIIIFGYGNIKYLLLDLLFVFPVRQEEGMSWGVA